MDPSFQENIECDVMCSKADTFFSLNKKLNFLNYKTIYLLKKLDFLIKSGH